MTNLQFGLVELVIPEIFTGMKRNSMCCLGSELSIVINEKVVDLRCPFHAAAITHCICGCSKPYVNAT